MALECILGSPVVLDALKQARQALYTALASAGGSLLGFIITSVSVVIVFGGMPRFNLMRSAGQFDRALGAYFQAIQWLAFATVWALAGLVFDTDQTPRLWYSYVMLWLFIVTSVRLNRCVWLLRELCTVAAARTVQEVAPAG